MPKHITNFDKWFNRKKKKIITVKYRKYRNKYSPESRLVYSKRIKIKMDGYNFKVKKKTIRNMYKEGWR